MLNLSYGCGIYWGVSFGEQEKYYYLWKVKFYSCWNSPWSEFSHLRISWNAHPGLVLKSGGPDQRVDASHSPVCFEAVKTRSQNNTTRYLWIATNLDQTHPWPGAPQFIGWPTVGEMVPAATTSSSWPQTGRPSSSVCVRARCLCLQGRDWYIFPAETLNVFRR